MDKKKLYRGLKVIALVFSVGVSITIIYAFFTDRIFPDKQDDKIQHVPKDSALIKMAEPSEKSVTIKPEVEQDSALNVTNKYEARDAQFIQQGDHNTQTNVFK